MGRQLASWLALVVSAGVLLGAWRGWLPDRAEALGFVTGAWCVWLAVKQNVWNWPLGMANNIFFMVVFWKARLYASMGLQVVFLSLAVYGLYQWLRGGERHTHLRVSRVTPRTAAVLIVLALGGTVVLTRYLRSVNDVAPLLDATTTVMSVTAQFLMARKVLEHWLVWIAADVLLIWLYAGQRLYLTALLYFIFLLMCVQGRREWKASLETQQAVTPATEVAN
jgi:nicotinamide mononucleotide transporter